MKVILDLDTGIDDAMALALALALPDSELIGVTCTYGNVTVAQSIANTRALLTLFGREDIPVLAGPEPDGFTVAEVSSFIHHPDGVGGVADKLRAGNVVSDDAASDIGDGDAIDFIIDAYARHGDDLRVVPTGPSTTIAAALRKAPQLADAPIVFMGGALTVPGNVTPHAEANVWQDPASTAYLFAHGRDVSMVGLDVTLRTLLTKEDTAAWRGIGTRAAELYADMVDYYISAYATTAPHLGGCGLHDPLALAAALDPSLIEWLPINLSCEEDGRTIGDPTRLGETPVHRAAVGVDIPRFHALLMDNLMALFARSA